MSDATLPAISKPRIAYHPLVQERFGIDAAGWRALIDAIWPAAKTAEAVILALSYCRARRLDPFKRPVHIVPIWSRAEKRMIESVWPGIGELRTTAFRTGLYAGRDRTEFGDDLTQRLGDTEVTFPEWAQVTIYRMVNGVRCPYPGPQVYWLETYAKTGRDTDAPNEMWLKRPRGQLDKCAEASSLRAAFPEELGNDYAAEEMAGQVIDAAPRPISIAATLDEFAQDAPTEAAEESVEENEPASAGMSPPPAEAEGAAAVLPSAAPSAHPRACKPHGVIDCPKCRPEQDQPRADRPTEPHAQPPVDPPAHDERAEFWSGDSYAVPQDRDPRKTMMGLLYWIEAAPSSAELDKLNADNKRTIANLALANKVHGQEIAAAFVKRRGELPE